MEIAVVGAGPVGLLAALGFQRLGARVRVFDPTTHKPAMSLAMAESTLQFLASLGVDALPGETLTRIHVSEQHVPGSCVLDAPSLGLPRFGQITCSQTLEQVLLSRVGDGLEPVAVTAVTARGQQCPPSVHLATGEHWPVDLVVLADGGRSPLSASAGFVAQWRPFQRTALLGRIDVTSPESGCAVERFVRTGPLALLPLGGARYGFVWSLAPAVADALSADPAQLVEALSTAIDPALGRIQLASPVTPIPLVERWIDQPYRPGLVCFGNGAQTIHPVAGQGLNLALRGVARVLSSCERMAPDAAVADGMQHWKADRNRTRLASSLLETLFRIQGPLRQAGTAIGLSTLDQSPSLKRRLALAGMGLLS